MNVAGSGSVGGGSFVGGPEGGASTGVAGPGAAGPGAIASGSAAALPPANPELVPAGPAPMVDTARVVKTGSLDLEVRAKAFAPALERITAIAVGLGGYVVESTTTEADKVPRGSITLRVTVGAFEQLVADVRKLGDVKAVTTKGTDVTAQFTDLDARLTALTATRDRLYEVLRAARNIGDIIAVQDRITGVQTEIEQLQGQQRLLNDQASFGTLAVTLAEPGGDQIQATPPRDAGFRHAFAVARHRFADSLQSIIAGTGAAAVPVTILAALAVVGRIVWRRERRRLI
jgi:hypothetical protein